MGRVCEAQMVQEDQELVPWRVVWGSDKLGSNPGSYELWA